MGVFYFLLGVSPPFSLVDKQHKKTGKVSNREKKKKKKKNKKNSRGDPIVGSQLRNRLE